MAQQEELEAFFKQISDPLRIAVYRELFTKTLLKKNTTIKETMNEIASDNNQADNLEQQNS